MTSRRVALAVASLVAIAIGSARAQPTAGRVVDAETGAPIANVRIRVDEATDQDVTRSDRDGRFALPLMDGGHTLQLSKAGYTTVRVDPAHASDIRLVRGGVIAGHVRDLYGTPLPIRRIVAERRVDDGGGPARFEMETSTDTDDTGEYRLYGLPPGQYAVGFGGNAIVFGFARAPAPRADQAMARYYPAAARPDLAQLFSVTPGADISGIDFAVPLPTAAFGAPAAPRRTTTDGSGIRGRIVRADGSIARRARVEVSSAGRLFSPVIGVSDDDGVYQVAVPAGEYFVQVTDVSLTTARYGQRPGADAGARVAVAAGALTDHIDVVVPRMLAISGRIVDDVGEPIDGVTVHVEQVRSNAGRRRIAPVLGVAPRQTDDRGRFRIFGLPPGRYIVRAAVDGQRELDTYYPGTVSASDATAVEVDDGQDALNVEFRLSATKPARMAGRVFGANGETFDGTVRLLASARSNGIAAALTGRATATNGVFSFDRLAPGEYVLQAATARRSPSVEGEFGLAYVTVAAGETSDIVLRLTTGSTVSGRVLFDGGYPPPSSDIEVSSIVGDVDFVSLGDDPVARADIHDDWTFDMGGLHGPRRLVVPRLPKAWMVDSIRVNGADITDDVIEFGRDAQSLGKVEVTLTNRVTEVSGTAAGAGANAGVVAFATDPALWYPRSRYIAVARVVDDAFSIRRIPPREYYVTTFDPRDLPDGTSDPAAFLLSLRARATRITIAAGDRVAVSLQGR